MYHFISSFSFSNSLAENKQRRRIEQKRKNLIALNLKIGGVIKTTNGVEVVSGFDKIRARIKTFSGRQYEPTEIVKVG